MKHRYLAFIIALLSGAIITLLLIPAHLSNKQLWILFFVTASVIFILVWVFNEYIIYRDLNKLDLLLKKLASDPEYNKIDLQSLKLRQTQDLATDINNYFRTKNILVDDLLKKSDLRKQFIADVSHELKSPLFSAQGYVHTLLDGAIKDKAVRDKFLKKAARNLDYLDILVQDLLTLSQIESQAIRMLPEHFDIVSLALEVKEDRESRATKAGVTVTCNFDEAPSIVYGDYTRITQVLTNLINNGINYNKKGGSVSIDINEQKDGVLISVIDTGEGIAKEYHEKVFNRFFRIDKSRTMKKSTGLGLAIVKHILENHFTRINIDSELGKGSTFSFKLARDKVSTSEQV
ncbi:MAG: two-component sensor histidine kinase [Bacteroidetes bacterium]|nr:MAG: two-component sensor histidine kinase [Bacteroidota bacterium]